ncbi:HNH nuclease [uncultured Caudovirales phage]|uniref:HNH nuclease n=1 Tax=uncultured Caudovirales phage TaxID=2100421 RepID=A0A6J5NHV3_9CAUD|nr:HNH nuclease [uncultured Caudovirales phage]
MKTLDELNEHLEYRPNEGAFYWRINNQHPKARKGMRAGRVNALGRAQIGIARKQVFVHKLVWLFETGVWPTEMIDHINGDPLDNHFKNLRLSNHKLNGQNQKAYRPKNKSTQLLGASWHKGKNRFISAIKIDGVRKHLGYFSTAEEAHTTYVAAKRIYHEANTL